MAESYSKHEGAPGVGDTVRIPRARWLRMSVLIFFAYLACYVDRSNISVAAPVMVCEFSMTSVVTGVLLASFFWGYVVMQVPGGWLASRYGPKWVIVTSLVVGITGILTGLARTYDEIVVIRFIMGVAEGVLWPSFAAIIMRWFPSHEPSRAVNLAQYVLPVSSVIMAPIAGYLIQLSDWHVVFIAQGVPLLFLALAWIMWASSDPAHDRRLDPAERRMILAGSDENTGEIAPFSTVLRRR
ncbi:MAG: hypothetical protein CPDRYMAC_6417 [uncultured Paraburkholderia sp.]|nr:MAG: hypothetical protein CPDRYDRY_6317 [uncultured Paraburkholderia sp.]CAH2944396.1 MAG: hypothetical protein CPDRYMAC_6417 [uncultured Paraburkholderia sp.]